jgi:hypothetical protein
VWNACSNTKLRVSTAGEEGLGLFQELGFQGGVE